LFYLCANYTKLFLYHWKFIDVLNVLEHIINNVNFNDFNCSDCITLIISYLSDSVFNCIIIHYNFSESLLFKCKNYYVRSFCSILYSFKFLFASDIILFVAHHNEFSDASCINFFLLILYESIKILLCIQLCLLSS